ncbi:MAG: chemotaxis protein CheW [Burkholderiales bacterium]
MAQRINLRDYQIALMDSLQKAGATQSDSSKLSAAAGESNWVVPLAGAGEVLPVPELTPVPLTRPWFRGLANVRGNLFGIVDFAAFLGGAVSPIRGSSRLLLVGERYGLNCGLLVDRMLGLKKPDQLRLTDNPDPAPWLAARYLDDEGNLWNELNARELLQHPSFLQIAA